MRIGELARRTDSATSRIRFYEKKGLLPLADRLDNGYRDYPEQTVGLVKLIIVAQHLGFTLAEIRRFIPDYPQGLVGSDDIVAHLRDKVEAVDHHMNELVVLRDRLTTMIEHLIAQKDLGRCSEIDDLYEMALGEDL